MFGPINETAGFKLRLTISTDGKPHSHWGSAKGCRGFAWLDGGALLAGAVGRHVIIWEPLSGETLHTIGPFSDDIHHLDVMAGGNLLAINCYTELLIWNRAENRLEHAFADLGKINCMAVSPTNLQLLVSAPHTRLIDLTGALPPQELLVQTFGYSEAAWSPDGRFVALLLNGGSYRIWDASGREHARYEEQGLVTVCVAWSADGSALLIGGFEAHSKTRPSMNYLVAHDPQAAALRWRRKCPHHPGGLVHSPDGRLAIGRSYSNLLVWERAAWRLLAGPKCEYTAQHMILSHHPTLPLIAYAEGKTRSDQDPQVRIWELDLGALLGLERLALPPGADESIIARHFNAALRATPALAAGEFLAGCGIRTVAPAQAARPLSDFWIAPPASPAGAPPPA
ncbi:MAG TPA: hypothetical protein VGE07_12805 [Herpetosiphonaceae bacterium]